MKKKLCILIIKIIFINIIYKNFAYNLFKGNCIPEELPLTRDTNVSSSIPPWVERMNSFILPIYYVSHIIRLYMETCNTLKALDIKI